MSGNCLAARLDGPDRPPFLCDLEKGHEGNHHAVLADGEAWEWPQMQPVNREDLVERLIAGMATAAALAVANQKWAREEQRRAEVLRAAITQHHERIKTLGVNDHRGVAQWGGPWDHQLWATVDLPSGPQTVDESESAASHNAHGGEGR